MMLEEVAMLSLQFCMCGRAAWYGLWYKSLYWLGAFILTWAVIRGMNK